VEDFVFENPTRIVFGRGSISAIGPEISRYGSRILLVYGQGSIKKNGIYDQVMNSLKASGVQAVELPGVKSNPVLSLVYEGIKLARREKVEAVLAVGGGSVIDTAKAIAAGVLSTIDVWEYFMRRAQVERALPVLTVLTLAASASEMNNAVVMTNEKTAQKYSFRSPHVQPKVSILDPTSLFTLDREYTAYSAVDAVVHMLEGYFNSTAEECMLQDRMVEGLIRTIMEKAEIALKQPDDYHARAGLMWASTLAFNGLTTAGVGQTQLPVHMMGHSLSALFDTPHGASLSIVLRAWMQYALEKKPEKFARFAREIFGVSGTGDSAMGREGADRMRAWMKSIGCPTSLRNGGIRPEEIGQISENARGLALTWGLTDYTTDVIAGILTAAA
jgi:alcohol dehydrogenase YqhD (iron-dependent ADH family)